MLSGQGLELPTSPSLGQSLLLALHRAEEHALHGHEALPHEALGAAGALEAVGLGVPVVFPVGDALGLGLHRVLASHTLLERGG